MQAQEKHQEYGMESKLTIFRVTENDYGIYNCSATNEYGTNSMTTELKELTLIEQLVNYGGGLSPLPTVFLFFVISVNIIALLAAAIIVLLLLIICTLCCVKQRCCKNKKGAPFRGSLQLNVIKKCFKTTVLQMTPLMSQLDVKHWMVFSFLAQICIVPKASIMLK